MSNDVAKTPKGPAPAAPTQDAASRLKHGLMADALERMLGKEAEKPIVPGTPRVLLVLANYGHSLSWDHAKVLQRQMFDASAGGKLEMKFAFYAEDNAAGVRRFKITRRWIVDPGEMAGFMDRASCDCGGCFVRIHSALKQAVKENEERPMRAVVIAGDLFHDDQSNLDEAAILANQLRRAGTKLFLLQQSNDPATAHKLQYLARVSGAVYFLFDPRTQGRQSAEMCDAISIYAKGGEEAVKATGGPAATPLLEQLKQEPMPIIEAREHVRVKRDT